jgi:hypothetical protein
MEWRRENLVFGESWIKKKMREVKIKQLKFIEIQRSGIN